jgi:hypothetical protein
MITGFRELIEAIESTANDAERTFAKLRGD